MSKLIDAYDYAAIHAQAGELMKHRKHLKQSAVDNYLKWFDEKCPKSKAETVLAQECIPGGIQHNLANNHPFALTVTKANGPYLYDIDGNWYYDLLQAGGPTIIGSNDPVVRDAVIDLLKTCGPSTGLFHEYEYKLAKKISDCVPSVDKFRMLGSGTEACMCAIRVARDIFALLPVSHVIVHALSEGNTVLSVDFERRIFTKLRFQGSDASDLVEEFRCNMDFDIHNGFQPVAQLEG